MYYAFSLSRFRSVTCWTLSGLFLLLCWPTPSAAQCCQPNFRFAFGSFGAGNGQFSHPRGVAVDFSGHIIVSDRGNRRIQVFGC